MPISTVKTRSSIPALARLGLCILVYLLLAKLSLLLAVDSGNTSAVWLAAGFSVALMLVYGREMWPVPLLGSVISVLDGGVAVGPALLIGLGNMTEALIVATLIKRYTLITDCFHTSKDVFKFIQYAAAGALVAAVVGPTVLLATGTLAFSDFPMSWVTWFLGDISGIILLAPVLLTWQMSEPHFWTGKKITEITLFSFAFLAHGLLVFVGLNAPLLFLSLSFLIWLAFRFSQKEVIWANLGLAIMATVGVLLGSGPFYNQPFSMLLLQIFVCIVGITALALSVMVDERRRAERELKLMHTHLEQMVQYRTRQLSQAVRALEDDIVKREDMQNALRAKEKQLEEAQRLAHMGSWEWSIAQDVLMVSDEMARIYGMPAGPRSKSTYRQYLEYIPLEERHLVGEVVEAAMLSLKPFFYEHHVVRPDGVRRYLRCGGTVEIDESGKPVKLYGTAHDVTESHALQTSLREAEELYRRLVELSPDAIYLLHEGKITFTNSTGLRLAAATHEDELLERNFIELVCPGDRTTVAEALKRLDHGEQLASVEGRLERRDGSVIDFELASTPFGIQRRQDTLLVVRDTSERKRIQAQMYHLAHHDPLTGLANRLLFKERLEHAIAQSHRTGKPLAILFVDLDRFKLINDTAGHGIGDQVLLECAQRLKRCLRDSDTVARTGGDEFLILIEAPSSPLHVPSVAQKVLTAIEQPFHVGGKEYSLSASIGISTYPADADQVEGLIQNADIAMYRAKTEGKGRFRYYSAIMAAQSRHRYLMEASLRRALDRHEMELYFQPKINLRSGRISGAEALIRWNHPEYGLLLPDQFIPLAEDMGLISDLGLWAVEETCKYCSQWRQEGRPQVRIAVNLAYSQFTDERFGSKVNYMLDNAGLDPSILEIEITETMVMENAERLMSILLELRRSGIHLSVDDFGTGYSSLAYLKRLPVDSVKVDRSFIKDLPTDSEDVAITHAVLALVHSLKRTVVAEGVETREQLQFLIENGCEEGQGFYFSRPLPAREFSEFLAKETVFTV